MRYARAYLQAFWTLFKAASIVFMMVWLLVGLKNIVALYLLYLIVVSSLAGVVKEWMGKEKYE